MVTCGYCHWRVGSNCIFILIVHLKYKILGSWFTFKHINCSQFKHHFWIREQLGYHNIFCFLQGLPENSPWANICYVNLAAIMQPKPVKQLMHQRYHFSIIPYHHPTPPNKKTSSLIRNSHLFLFTFFHVILVQQKHQKKRNHRFFQSPQEFSRWFVNGLLHLLIPRIYWGEITHWSDHHLIRSLPSRDILGWGCPFWNPGLGRRFLQETGRIESWEGILRCVDPKLGCLVVWRW